MEGSLAQPIDAVPASPDRCPTLVVIGGIDPYTPDADVADAEALGVQVVRYDEADHGFVHDAVAAHPSRRRRRRRLAPGRRLPHRLTRLLRSGTVARMFVQQGAVPSAPVAGEGQSSAGRG